MALATGALSLFMLKLSMDDWRHRQLLLSDLAFGWGLCAITWLFMPWQEVLRHGGSAAGLLVLLLLVSKATRGGLGEGDALAVPVMAGMAGPATALSALLLALVLSALASLVLLAVLRKHRKTALPFIFFLFAALEVVLCMSAVQ